MARPEKIQEAVELFKEGKDAREVARKLGYADTKGLSKLMRRYGYRWDPEKQNYVPDERSQGKPGLAAAAILEERAGEILALLDWFEKSVGVKKTVPNIRTFTGPTVAKGYSLPAELAGRLERFCRARAYKEKDVVVTAISEFLDRHA